MFSFLLSRSRGNYRVHHCRFQCHVIENCDAVIAKDEDAADCKKRSDNAVFVKIQEVANKS